ncbi:MAG: mucoidy inhibitor MuiA family protein [Spirochaetia bacterium]|nr:mucoidy inhibitor MuiA family protein [Spirochaetia bacterium]
MKGRNYEMTYRFLFLLFYFMEELQSENKITDVTVYHDRALITREAEISLKSGDYKILFLIPSNIDEDSIRASAAGPSQLKITGSGTKNIKHKTTPDISYHELEEKIEALKEQLEELQSKIHLKEQQKDYFMNTAKQCESYLPLAAKKGNFDIKNIESSAAFIFPRAESLDEEIRKLKKELKKLNKDLKYNSNLLDNHRRPFMTEEKSVFVSLEVNQEGLYKVKIQYVIGGAFWYPVYDARVNYQTSEIELSCLGMVQQNTGEDWNSVKLKLSTARPGMTAAPEYLDPLYVDFYRTQVSRPVPLQVGAPDPFFQKEAGEPDASRRSEDFDELSNDFSDSLEAPDPFEAAGEILNASVDSGGVSATYTIKTPADIPSDGEPHRQTISINPFKGSFDAIAVPRQELTAFLRAEVKNNSENIFLPGKVKIFLDNDFIGTGDFPLSAPGEAFEIFLGADDGIRVERNIIEIDIGKSGLLKGSIKQNFEYTIQVQNLKKTAMPVIIIDQYPVSHSADIKVETVKIRPEPYKSQKNHILFWKKTLNPEEKLEIQVRYSVEYPQGRAITNVK